MKRLYRLLRLIPLSLVALAVSLAVPLASCRSPVQGRPGASLSLRLSVPADLSSPIPEPLRRAVGEAELSGSRPRFIHPDGRVVKVVATKADSSEVGSVAAALQEGEQSASITVDDLPLGVPLTLTVSVYDAVDAKVGELVVDDVILDTEASKELSVNVLPFTAKTFSIGSVADPSLIAVSALSEGYHVYKAELPGPGLYSASLLTSGEIPNQADFSIALYDQKGQPATEYEKSVATTSYGLFINRNIEPATYYLILRINSSWTATSAEIKALRYSSAIALYGKSSTEVEAQSRLLTPGFSIDFGTLDSDIENQEHPSSASLSFTLVNLTNSDITISNVDVTTTTGSYAGTFSLANPFSVSLPAKKEESIEIVLNNIAGSGENTEGSVEIATNDSLLPSFLLSLSGYCAC